jgi:archaellum biogenesis ATPase FlaH
MKDYVMSFNTQPTFKEVGLKIKNSSALKTELKKEALQQIKLLSTSDNSGNSEFILKETERWIQKLELTSAIYKSVDILKNDSEFETIIGFVSDALKISFDTDTGLNYNSSIKERIEYYHKKLKGISSGISSLDKILGSGFLNKTLNIFVSPSHGGKSAMLVHAVASNLLKKKKILFLSLEMTEEEIAKRIDANILNIATNDFWCTSAKDFEIKFNSIAPSLGELVIKEYPSGTHNTLKLESLLNDLEKQSGFKPDIIAIDYLTLMASSRTTLAKAGGTYSYYKLISEELHGFAKKYGIPILTAAQLGRGAFNNIEADMASISDSIGIIQTADTVIALLSSDNLKANNQLMLKALKNRNTGRLDTIIVQTDFSKMRFTDLEDGTEVDTSQPIQLGLAGVTPETELSFEGFDFE